MQAVVTEVPAQSSSSSTKACSAAPKKAAAKWVDRLGVLPTSISPRLRAACLSALQWDDGGENPLRHHGSAEEYEREQFCVHRNNLGLYLMAMSSNAHFRLPCSSDFLPLQRCNSQAAQNRNHALHTIAETFDNMIFVPTSDAKISDQRCAECGHTLSMITATQTRGADEGMTDVLRCTNPECKVNGGQKE